MMWLCRDDFDISDSAPVVSVDAGLAAIFNES